MALTEQQLMEIASSPISSPLQQVEAKARLSELREKQAAKPEPEINTDGNVRLRGFQGRTYHRPGGWRCAENAKGVAGSFAHDIPARVISAAYAEELNKNLAEFGGCQGGEAQVTVDYEFSFGRCLVKTPEEQAAFFWKFPTLRRDLFSRPDPLTPEQVTKEAKDRAQLAARRRLKEISESGRYDKNCLEDWYHTDCKLDGPEREEIVQLLAIILEDLTALIRRGVKLDFKWRDMTKLLPPEMLPKEDSVVKEQP